LANKKMNRCYELWLFLGALRRNHGAVKRPEVLMGNRIIDHCLFAH